MSYAPFLERRRRMLTLTIHPTLGTTFTMSCSPLLSVDRFKEDCSDRLGISPRKMSVVYRSRVLKNGTLFENGVESGTEIRLVPSLESGVNTPVAMDPVAMMKHSMSGISDQQIDEFLAGKSALSVAIRLGESVVVVNLNRAKVEEIEVEPPEEEEKCTHAAMVPAGSTDADSGGPVVSSSRVGGGGSAGPLNTNPRWSPLPAHCKTSSIPAAKSLTKALTSSHSTSKNSLSHQTSSSSSMSSALGTGSGAGGFLAGSKRGAACATHPDVRTKRKAEEMNLSVRGPVTPSSSSSAASSPSKPTKIQLTQSEWEELQRLREIPTSQNGVSMKRKAVMEAIGEILKKMYAQRARGKIPGSFKGRFSSEFTCDSDMREIIHSKTTMTSCGDSDGASSVKSLEGGSYFLSDHKSKDDAKSQENQMMRHKVAQLRLKMQQSREERRAKRKLVDRQSPCDWMEEDSDCMDSPPPAKMAKKSAFCGLKPGFLL